MFVLVIGPGYPTLKYKMNGIFSFDQAKALRQSGIKIIYASVDLRSLRKWRKWGFEHRTVDGIEVYAINLPVGKITDFLLDKLYEQSLKILYKKIVSEQGNPDIIHSHFIRIGHSTVKALKKYSIPIFHTEHFSGMNQKILSKYLIEQGNETYSEVSKLITVSDHLSRNIIKNFNISPIIVPNIVDMQNFKFTERNCKADYFDFVSTGNLLKNKRMDLLIDSFYAAFKDNNKVRLYVFGEGPEKSNLNTQIKYLNLQDRIFLKGLVDRKVIAKKMNESRCFVLVSKLETFGVAYIEAMATGLPVIATKCGGPEDFITKENGLLLEHDNINYIANALNQMYSNIDYYDCEKISLRTKELFGEETFSNKMMTLYKEYINSTIN